MKISLDGLTPAERRYFSSVLSNDEVPDLEGLWALMDAAWKECGCDPEIMDDRISKFYAHPVWLLNGFFCEQHLESLNNRRDFTNYVASLEPRRIADFGGGYGTLARMIAERCPDTEVHVIEPHPLSAAASLAEKTLNVRYMPDFTGEYDVLIATDVFEHVPDPLSLVERTAAHLRVGGEYLMANCFLPVTLCHLPSTFHFRWSWDAAMEAMNLKPGRRVSYGRVYRRGGMPSRIRGRIAWFLVSGRLVKKSGY